MRKISSRFVNFEELNTEPKHFVAVCPVPHSPFPPLLFTVGFYSCKCCLQVCIGGSNPGHHHITQSGKTRVINKGKKYPFVVIKEILQER